MLRSGLVGHAGGIGTPTADAIAVEAGEVVVVVLVELDWLPMRVLAAAARAHGQFGLLGAKPGALEFSRPQRSSFGDCGPGPGLVAASAGAISLSDAPTIET